MEGVGETRTSTIVLFSEFLHMTYGSAQAPPDPPGFTGVFSRTFLLALLVGTVGYLLWKDVFSRPRFDADADARPVTARGDLAADEATTIALFEAASPSVVHISTLRRQAVRRGFFRTNVLEIPEGSGSGFLWDDQGNVVTNYHVLQGGNEFVVRLNDQSEYRARIVGGSPEYDLAVIHIDAPRAALVPIPVGTSRELRVGQKTFAIGNPFGLDQTLTTGVVSGLEREILSVGGTPIRGVIQTDAAINPGNSGGPLLDSAGRLVGVNTAIKSPSGAYAGVGFAVPVDTVNRIVPQILRKGHARRGGLGVELAHSSIARRMGWRGALVDRLLPDSAAERAGLQDTQRGPSGELRYGDLIIGLDGQAIETNEDLQERLQGFEPGETVELELVRDPSGEAARKKVTLQLREL